MLLKPRNPSVKKTFGQFYMIDVRPQRRDDRLSLSKLNIAAWKNEAEIGSRGNVYIVIHAYKDISGARIAGTLPKVSSERNSVQKP